MKTRITLPLGVLLAAILVATFVPARALASESGGSNAGEIVAGIISDVSHLAPDSCGDSGGIAPDFRGASGGIVPETTSALSIHDANGAAGRLRVQAALPSRYSAVEEGRVTPVRDQGLFGTCWAFSTLAAVESSLLAHNQVSDAQSLDLAERHLAYFTYHAATDPLGNTEGDTTMATGSDYGVKMSDPYLNTGGNNCMAAFTLASWQGAVPEKVAPYQDLTAAYIEDNLRGSDGFLKSTALDASLAYAQDAFHVEDVYRIATTDLSDVKQAIVNHGSVAVLVNSDYVRFGVEHTVLYNGETGDTNHSVALVGWDDGFDRSNFGDGGGMLPNGNGAWLAKNSWGSWGEDGYFWISYEDRCLLSSYSKAYAFSLSSADASDNIYQYDGSTGDYYNYLPSGGSIANVFTAAGNDAKGGAERLDAVSFSLDDVNVDYSIQVYANLQDVSNPTSGAPVLSKPISGRTTYEGYYTVRLPNPVCLREGDVFAVVITLSHANGERVNYCVDATGRLSWGVNYTSEVSPGQSFERSSSGSSWNDLASSTRLIPGNEVRCAARIKAFTHRVGEGEVPPTPLSLTKAAFVDSAAAKACVYDGSAKKPRVKVSFGSKTLVAGTDYIATYRNNVKAGTAYVDIAGRGGYTGTVTLSFPVAKARISLSGISFAGKTYTYNGTIRSLAIGGKLPPFAKVTYSGNGKKAVGAYTVKATFTSKDANHYIAKADAAKTARLKIVQGKQVLAVAKAQLSKTVSFKKLKKTAQYTGKVVVTGAKTTVSYKKLAGSSKHLSIGAKTGKVKVRKGVGKGVYKIKAKATAANNAKTYKAASKTFTVAVRVR